MRLIDVQFYSPQTYTYEVPDEWPDEVQEGDLVLVPVGDHSQMRNYTEKWKVTRFKRELNSDEVMVAKAKAKKLGFEIKKASLYLGPENKL